MNGFINLLKVPGITSSTAVSLVKRIYGLKKVGHAGTLDPGAAGVLPIMVNRATKLFDYLQDAKKEYIAEFVFGIGTDTLDMQGEIVSREIKEIKEDELIEILPDFIGKIKQIPPKVSAISINGKKAYDLSRTGKKFEIPEREVDIFDISLIRKTGYNSFLIKIRCSKGTYIRSLCMDIAEKLGTYGYINYLLRTESSEFKLSDAVSIDELKQTPIDDVLIPPEYVLDSFGEIDLEKESIIKLFNGIHIQHDGEERGLHRLYSRSKFIGLANIDNGKNIKLVIRFLEEEDL